MPVPSAVADQAGAPDPFEQFSPQLRAALRRFAEAHFSAGDWRKDDDEPYSTKHDETHLAAGELAAQLAALASTPRAR